MNVSIKNFVKNKENKFLVLRRSSTHPTMPFYWDVPGGHLEEGENLVEAIQRETYEETGFKTENIKLLGVEADFSNSGKYWVQIAYVCEVDSPEVIISYEHDQFKWVSPEEFFDLETTEMLKKLFSLIDN